MLLDKAGAKVHAAVMPRVKAPHVVTWGARAFALKDLTDEVATYREVDAFRIGV